MALDALRWAFALPDSITPTQRHLLTALAYRVNAKARYAWPAVATLCAMTGLKRRTVFKALDDLESLGLIHRTQRANRTTAYRLACHHPGMMTGASNAPGGCTTCTSDPTPGCTTCTVKKEHLLKDNTKDKEAATASVAAKSSGESMKLPKGMSVAAIMAKTATEHDLPDEEIAAMAVSVNGVHTVNSIETVWKYAHGKYRKGESLKPMTGKQLGQLKSAIKGAGEILPFVIVTVMEDWSGFVVRCKKDAGNTAFNPPTKPEIGFFLTHINHAIDFTTSQQEPEVDPYAEQKAAVAAKMAQKAPAAPPVQLTAKPIPEVPKVPSFEELQAMFAEVEAEAAAKAKDGTA